MKKDNESKTIPDEVFSKLFKLGFCATVQKYQGATIRQDYNIRDTKKMSFNEMYTALSRGVSLNKVHFNYTDKICYTDLPPTATNDKILIR